MNSPGFALIQSSNSGLPAGSVRIGARGFNVRTSNRYESLEDIQETPVAARDGMHLDLGDIADVGLGYAAHMYRTRMDGRRCLFISIQQGGGSDIFAVAAGVRAKTEAHRRELPPGMDLQIGFDQSAHVSNRIGTFAWSLVQGIVLVGIAIFFAIGFRPALVVGVAIPTSFLIGIGFTYLSGYGIHQMTITGLIIALGLLVDNAIVITESIVRYQRMGMGRREAV